MICLQYSQFLPTRLAGHLHLYLPFVEVQRPPRRQGKESHGSINVSEGLV